MGDEAALDDRTAAGGFAPSPGEAVYWTERRAPPSGLAAGIAATILLVLALFDWRTPISAPLVALAVLLVALGVRAQRRGWSERYWITDRRVVVEVRGGAIVALPTARITDAEARGPRVAFSTDDGEELEFAVVQEPGRLLRRLPQWLPGVTVARLP